MTDDQPGCNLKGPYYPVGDVDFECRTHGVTAVLRDPARYGAADIRLDEVRCPVGEVAEAARRLEAEFSWIDTNSGYPEDYRIIAAVALGLEPARADVERSMGLGWVE